MNDSVSDTGGIMSNRSTRKGETACHNATLYTKNSIWADLGRNLGLRSDRPTSNRPITALWHSFEM
jgi:hypothetical protein